MVYIKRYESFENDNDDLYQKVSLATYKDKLKNGYESFTSEEYTKINNAWSDHIDSKDFKITLIDMRTDILKTKSCCIMIQQRYDIDTIKCFKLTDEYYTVKHIMTSHPNESIEPDYYVCDTFEGLLNCLRNINIGGTSD